ncbi:MAG: ABC transporter substrate-binding protein [Alkalispirochaeta sp.]
MKKTLYVLAALLIVAGTVYASGSSEAEALDEEMLVVGQIAEPKALDPHTVTAVNDFRILVNIYEGLVQFQDGSLTVEPALARSWEISDDGRVYTFHLREGVSFHDGTPFNAEAVKFNFDRMLDEDHPYYGTGPFPLAFFFSSINETRVVDEYTVQLVLDEPFAPLLSNLAYPTGLLVSPEAVREHGEDYGRNPVGTGPFRFVEWVGNTRVTVEANPDYWDTPAGVDRIIFRPITDSNTRVTEMLSGGLDMIVEVPPDSVEVFESRDEFTVYEQAGPHVWFLILNLREGPFTSREMRQAVNYAIDKEALVENVLQGTATVADSPIPPAFDWAYNEDLDPYPYDPDRARELIEEAEYDGEELVFYVTEGGSGMLDPVPMGTAIQADLAAVGLDVSIETYEWNTFLERVNPGLEGKADMAQMAWMTNDPDTLPFLTLRTEAFPDNGGFNSGYYSNPDVDDLLEQARQSTDLAERARLYREMQAIVYEDAPWVFVANWKQNAVAVEGLKNFSLQPSFLLELGEVSFD